jgi:carboxypeptidase D
MASARHIPMSLAWPGLFLQQPMDGSESLVSLIQRAQLEASSSTRRGALTSRDGSPSSDQTQYTAASFYVPRLPKQPQDVQLPIMYSGHLPASYSLRDGPKAAKDAQSDAHLFWLLVKAKHIADRQKLVIWFNGGMHCAFFWPC